MSCLCIIFLISVLLNLDNLLDQKIISLSVTLVILVCCKSDGAFPLGQETQVRDRLQFNSKHFKHCTEIPIQNSRCQQSGPIQQKDFQPYVHKLIHINTKRNCEILVKKQLSVVRLWHFITLSQKLFCHSQVKFQQTLISGSVNIALLSTQG